ncbi:DNA repair protein RadC [Novosphingobium profundi]|nr:DNA repair protein RadC [Novosphingobium profundi]
MLVAVYVDEGGHALGDIVLDSGGGDWIGGRYRTVLEPALRLGAHGFLLAHNHPSGDPRASRADIRATRALAALARALDTELVDHLVVGGGEVTSLRAAGLVEVPAWRRVVDRLPGGVERRRRAA